MSHATVSVRGEVLEWARVQSGYNLSVAAKRLQISPERLAEWEATDDRIPVGKLRLLAELYRVSPAAFSVTSLPEELYRAPKDFRRLPSGAPTSYSPELRREFRRVQEQISFLAELSDSGIGIHRFQGFPDPLSTNVTEAGIQIRTWLNLNLVGKDSTTGDQFDKWALAIEGRGILVTQISKIPLSEMRGFCLHDTIPPLIALNGADVKPARLFTLVHELTHLISGENSVCNGVLNTGSTSEKFCNSVAAAALIPIDELEVIVTRIGKSNEAPWTLTDLARVAKPFGVSREAALRRLHSLSMISGGNYRSALSELRADYAEAKKRKKSSGGPAPDVMAVRNLGSTYSSLIIGAYHSGLLTELEAAKRLFTRVSWVQPIGELLQAKSR